MSCDYADPQPPPDRPAYLLQNELQSGGLGSVVLEITACNCQPKRSKMIKHREHYPNLELSFAALLAELKWDTVLSQHQLSGHFEIKSEIILQ